MGKKFEKLTGRSVKRVLGMLLLIAEWHAFFVFKELLHYIQFFFCLCMGLCLMGSCPTMICFFVKALPHFET